MSIGRCRDVWVDHTGVEKQYGCAVDKETGDVYTWSWGERGFEFDDDMPTSMRGGIRSFVNHQYNKGELDAVWV